MVESVLELLAERIASTTLRSMLSLGLLPNVDQPNDEERALIEGQVEADVDLYEEISTSKTLAGLVEPIKKRKAAKRPARIKRRKVKRGKRAKGAQTKPAKPEAENEAKSNNGKAVGKDKRD